MGELYLFTRCLYLRYVEPARHRKRNVGRKYCNTLRSRRTVGDVTAQASDTAFVCPVCVQRFSTSKALMRHQAQLHTTAGTGSAAVLHSGLRKVTCAICTVDFANERELLAHLVGAQHKDMKVRVKLTPPNECRR